MNLEHATPDLFAALAVAQGAIEGAKKDSTNPAFKSKYADLSSVIEAAQKPLATSGLSLTFSMGHEPTGIAVTPLLAHKTGGYILFDTLRVPCEAKAQQQGSAMTYARRYLTMSILGIPTEDDDGHAASQRPQETRREPVQNPQRAPERAPEPKPAAPAAGVTKGPPPKHPAFLKGGEELKNVFTSDIDGHLAFREEEIAEYRKEYAKLGNQAINPEAVQGKVDAFVAEVKAELLKRAGVSEEFSELAGSVTVEDAPAQAVDANPQGLF